jgi:RNA polymerase sigma-70 factor (ECF subfamily)
VDAVAENARSLPMTGPAEGEPPPLRPVEYPPGDRLDDLVPPTTPAVAPDMEDALHGALRGEEAGFTQIYRAVAPGLLRYLSTFVGDQNEDVASETWSQVCRDLSKFKGDYGQFRGWVTTIGRNRAIDHRRAQSRRPATPTAPEQLHYFPGTSDTPAEADNSMSTGRAIALISSLPADQAEAVLLRVVMGLDAKTAGRVLRKRPGTVRTLSHRGLKALAARLETNNS